MSKRTDRVTRFFSALCAFLLFCALFLLFFPVFSVPLAALNATASSLDLTGRGAGYSAVLYDAKSGMPTSEANAVVRSKDGFIWIGAYSGLIRYDGNEFYRYPSSSGIASVVSLFCDSRDRLWIGTNDSGVAVFYDDEFVFYGKNEGLRSSSVRSIEEDENNTVYIATTKGVACVGADGILQIIDNPQISSEYVCELCRGADGVVYGVTLSGGIFTLRDRKVAAYISASELGIDDVNTIYPDPDHPGYVYLGTQRSGIFRGNLFGRAADFEELSAQPHVNINAIRLIGGVLWVCADNGVGYFTDTGAYVPLHDLPMTNSIDHIMEDVEGNLWFTSSRQGLMKIVRNRFTDLSAMAKLEGFVANSTCLSGGDLYIGTDTGLYVLDGNYAAKENAATALLSGARIRCIKRAGGYLWFCTYSANGLVRYDPEKDELYVINKDKGIASDRVRMLTELSDGRLAVATNAGLNIVKDGEVTALYNGSNGVSNLEILCVEEARDGSLYLGSDGDGIYKITGNSVARLGSDEGLSSEVILRIKKDPDKDLFWVITSNSLAYMKDDKITTVRNFPYPNNFDLCFDGSGRAWVLSSNGIYVVKRDDLLANKNIEFTHYNADCGMPGVATANSYSDVDAGGTLYVAASTGVFSVNIEESTDSASSVMLSIPFVKADDRTIWIHNSEEITVPSSCKRLNIYANAMTYSLSDPHLSYRLEGFDDEPVKLTKREMSYASYTNLAGGTYVFSLSSINELTGEVENTVSIRIVKEMALTERLWFRILFVSLCCLLLVAAVFLFFRRKTARLQRKQEESRKLITEMAKVFSGCIDMKDPYTNGHSARVAKYTSMIARRMGKSEQEASDIYNIALLHDIGKISIPDSILNKPDRLTNEEFALMKTHAARGREILEGITIAPDIAQGAGYHHEKYDGSGYPAGLAGDNIPEIAQMIAVADTFDAMYSTRPYRKQMPLETVLAEIKKGSGTQFSPKVVEVFLQLASEGAFDDAKEPDAGAQAPSASS